MLGVQRRKQMQTVLGNNFGDGFGWSTLLLTKSRFQALRCFWWEHEAPRDSWAERAGGQVRKADPGKRPGWVLWKFPVTKDWTGEVITECLASTMGASSGAMLSFCHICPKTLVNSPGNQVWKIYTHIIDSLNAEKTKDPGPGLGCTMSWTEGLWKNGV